MPNPATPPPLPEGFKQALHNSANGLNSWRDFDHLIRTCMKIESQRISQTVLKRDGVTVQSGPFKGMTYCEKSSEGAHATRLLGLYEYALQSVIEEVISRDYEIIMDIGSAEGYYAIGLARRMPHATILAYDNNTIAQDLCRNLAETNGVATQIENKSICLHHDFDIALKQKTFILCDIEGAEFDLLDPEKAAGLQAADILVETHPQFSQNVLATLKSRFDATHEIIEIKRKLNDPALPAWMDGWGDLERLACLWEWRTQATPWLWMKKK